MKIEDFILFDYPKIMPYVGILSIENKLKENEYLVIIDENNNFQGILTSSDIISRPHKLAIDCMTDKEIILTDDTYPLLLDKFKKTPSVALPVFKDGKFLGILEKNTIIQKIKSKMDSFQKEAEISQSIKTEFLNNFSHELRTPLNQIIGFMNIISELSSDDLDKVDDQYYSIVKKSSEQFLGTMDDLIELSRINSGEEVQIFKDCSIIESIFNNLSEYFEIKAQYTNNKTKLHFINPDKTRTIYSDIKRIKQILFHLINNSIKHVNEGSVIEICYTLINEEQNICFQVRNSEKLILDSDYTNIKIKDSKISTSYNSLQNGFDFGLGIIQKIADLINGKITFETDSNNNFTYSLEMPYIAEVMK